ncbi:MULTISPECIES: LTA synthase family protein [Flavobacterium]|uniref:Sulfatase-like hydrolase/transferase n=1 Tax=Flavobacterium hankyongi TaxID=1176532 RepID=A0ABP8ZRQ2_9FLAO|nr:LTA synthase family protein [Flavobacterium sp. N1846]
MSIMLFIELFSFAAEFPFWDEFKTKFNFIAVDYLIYTYEVVENINQSYPIPMLIFGLAVCIFLILYFFRKKGIFKYAFSDQMRFGERFIYTAIIVISSLGMLKLLQNKQAEFSSNTYVNELTKNGVFSFFSALIANELDYQQFYSTLPEKEVYTLLKKELLQENENFTNTKFDNITRKREGKSTENPNIILISIESFSAEFLQKFGNKQNLTTSYENLASDGIFFTNMFATGTRTVRGMEALMLCVPPTPGNSIVRRPNNDQLFSIATILKKKNYDLKFIYGGDGYFDNMNAFFGGQGFTIVDRNRGNPLPENIKTERINIEDKDVTFENAWGICDEDIYNQSLKMADLKTKSNQPFFQFIMTTSNHKPFTFPENKISMKEGSRESAIKYTDYALGEFIKNAKTKSWFSNTVFVIVADHCASSAGKWEINTEKHHIPAVIFNFKSTKMEVGKLASQIDLMPTLFSLFDWNFENATFGKNIFIMKPEEERALIGNYRTLGLLKNNIFTQIDDHKNTRQFLYNHENKTISNELKLKNEVLKKVTISYYQAASERFKNGKMKERSN